MSDGAEGALAPPGALPLRHETQPRRQASTTNQSRVRGQRQSGSFGIVI
jgi:hypothetical protein